ncbi:hypothetical protein [Ruminococcus sp.]|uniref:hypothetical protein n=1 Tax=Ruminococcus sp. TaxID=41978 RepID=UPI00260134C5|nr:hypothetical protein [Ruminococcus sp.]MBQ6250989.1 hypothetical protein [Ruminococcus sp.]
MEFNTQQVNNLLTGVILACELNSNNPKTRRFLTLKSFDIGIDNKRALWDKTVKSYSRGDKALFIIHVYSVPAEYIELNYDIDDYDLTENIMINDIIGWTRLYEELSKIINDFSILLPQWHCDNPLE